jgi:lipopolysaccharide assembly outer membrane protein LptD (OstA)
MKRAAPVLVVLLLLVGWAHAQESTPSPPRSAGEPTTTGPDVNPFLHDLLQSNLPLQLEADQVDYDRVHDVYHATGNVVLRQQDSTLTADAILLDMATGVLICDGAVTITNPRGSMHADSLQFELHQETAVMSRALFIVRNKDLTFFIRGRRIEKIGPERYLIYHGNYTTCDCGAEEADWMVEADFIDVTFDDYAVVEHGRVYIEGLPVAYVPYGIFPAKVNRSSGFLWPTTGWASDDGYHIGLPYYWNQAPYADATLYTDWYQHRGTKLGWEQRWEISRDWAGDMTGYPKSVSAAVFSHGNESRFRSGIHHRFSSRRRPRLRSLFALRLHRQQSLAALRPERIRPALSGPDHGRQQRHLAGISAGAIQRDQPAIRFAAALRSPRSERDEFLPAENHRD